MNRLQAYSQKKALEIHKEFRELPKILTIYFLVTLALKR